jgi:hypothetical protein
MHARTSTEIPAQTEQPATLKNYFCNNNAGSMQAGVAATFVKIWNASALWGKGEAPRAFISVRGKVQS